MSVSYAITGQSLRVNMNIGTDITGYDEVLVKYKDPNMVETEVNATVTNPATGAIYIDVSPSTLSVVGDWNFMCEVTIGSEVLKTFSSIIRVMPEYSLPR